jgi:hypothetical protein
MPTKLHQILALEKGAKSSTESAVTLGYHEIQRTALFQGLTRVYTPRDSEDGDRLPTERKRVQLSVEKVLQQAAAAWTTQSDVVATKDATNQVARADVIVDGRALLEAVPVTTLLYLEKMLLNVRTLIVKAPVLDPETTWSHDPATSLWRSEVEETVRTKKIPKAFVKAPATDKHAAQVDVFTEDIIVGNWAKTLFSGALPADRKTELLRRVEELASAVKVAREYANQAVVVDRKIGQAIFDHLLA